jgi:hypothetical protein
VCGSPPPVSPPTAAARILTQRSGSRSRRRCPRDGSDVLSLRRRGGQGDFDEPWSYVVGVVASKWACGGLLVLACGGDVAGQKSPSPGDGGGTVVSTGGAGATGSGARSGGGSGGSGGVPAVGSGGSAPFSYCPQPCVPGSRCQSNGSGDCTVWCSADGHGYRMSCGTGGLGPAYPVTDASSDAPSDASGG